RGAQASARLARERGQRDPVERHRARRVCRREASRRRRQGPLWRGGARRRLPEPSTRAVGGPSMKSERPKLLRAYGDRAGDGMVQMCFTLELAPSPKAKEAARRFAQAHGLEDVLVTCMEQCGPEHTYFVVYGHSKHQVDATRIEVAVAEVPELSKEEIDKLVAERLGRKIVVVGACTGSDAHTVGID